MLTITRQMCREQKAGPIEWGATPLQAGMGGCPWRVCVASMLCNRTKRTAAEPVLKRILEVWRCAAELARADQAILEAHLQPLGLQRVRARRLIRFSSLYTADGWTDLRELPGVGAYVNDAVGLCVFGCADLESSDGALEAYADKLYEDDDGLHEAATGMPMHCPKD